MKHIEGKIEPIQVFAQPREAGEPGKLVRYIRFTKPIMLDVGDTLRERDDGTWEHCRPIGVTIEEKS
jgi:hypothetical protein